MVTIQPCDLVIHYNHPILQVVLRSVFYNLNTMPAVCTAGIIALPNRAIRKRVVATNARSSNTVNGAKPTLYAIPAAGNA